MATVYSAQFAAAYNTVPRTKRDPSMRGVKQATYWDYTQSGAGNDPDTLYTIKIPAGSRLLLPECALWTEGCPAGSVYNFGYLAYTEPDGDAVTVSTNGLLASVDGAADNLVFGGMNTGAGTPDDQRPAVLTWWFNSREDVTLTITISSSALQDGDVLRGYYTWING